MKHAENLTLPADQVSKETGSKSQHTPKRRQHSGYNSQKCQLLLHTFCSANVAFTLYEGAFPFLDER
jgi:hypothetical protein